ncbi:MAG: hypothetical protein PHQ05_13080 [Sterolibacterium sp.]|nr:hypothetical protein [Sterolibacterium sp.]
MQLPSTLTLHPSKRLALLLLVAHGGALGLIAAVPLPFWIKLVLLLGVLLSAWHALKCSQGRQRIVRLTLREDGVLDYARLGGEVGEAHVHPQTTVTPQLTVVLLRSKRRIEPLVLLPDSLDAEEFRKLCLWLRWRAALD